MSTNSDIAVYRTRTKRAAEKTKSGQGVQDLGFGQERKLVMMQMAKECE